MFRRKIGIVFQDHKLLHDRTVFDNVALPLMISSLRRRELRGRVRAALDQVGLLRYESQFPLSLSSGEQQRVGIARAVASRPELVIADEPQATSIRGSPWRSCACSDASTTWARQCSLPPMTWS